MMIRTVKISNVSLGATEQDIKEFFSFSGEIEHVELHSDNERSQIARVVFKDPQGAETAVLLSVCLHLLAFSSITCTRLKVCQLPTVCDFWNFWLILEETGFGSEKG